MMFHNLWTEVVDERGDEIEATGNWQEQTWSRARCSWAPRAGSHLKKLAKYQDLEERVQTQAPEATALGVANRITGS